MIKKIVKSLLIGIVFLYAYNFLCGLLNFDFIIPINLFTICLIGFLRLPGVIIVLLILFL